jgi:hypothetical protein
VSALDPAMVAGAIIRSLKDDTLIQTARQENERLVLARADYRKNMLDVESGYEMLARSRSHAKEPPRS